jgi:hypothetical protein
MNITRCFMVFLAASLLLVPAAICQAQDHPAAGPVGSPEGIWRAQIHWIPMTDGARWPTSITSAYLPAHWRHGGACRRYGAWHIPQ